MEFMNSRKKTDGTEQNQDRIILQVEEVSSCHPVDSGRDSCRSRILVQIVSEVDFQKIGEVSIQGKQKHRDQHGHEETSNRFHDACKKSAAFLSGLIENQRNRQSGKKTAEREFHQKYGRGENADQEAVFL